MVKISLKLHDNTDWSYLNKTRVINLDNMTIEDMEFFLDRVKEKSLSDLFLLTISTIKSVQEKEGKYSIKEIIMEEVIGKREGDESELHKL